MKWLKYGALVLIFLLLVPALMCFAALSIIKFKILNPDLYIKALEKNNGYGLIESQVTQKFSGVQVPQDYTKSQIDSRITSVFAYINAESDTLDLKVDVRPIKQQYKPGSIEASLIPDYIDMAPTIDTTLIHQARKAAGIAKAGMYALAAFILILLEGAFLLFTSKRNFLRFSGASFMITGIGVLLPALLAPFMFAQIQFPKAELSIPIISSIGQDIASFAVYIALIIAGGGILLLAVSFIQGFNQQKAKPSKVRPKRKKK